MAGPAQARPLGPQVVAARRDPPERWEFAEELLQLLWVLEETVRLQPEGAALLDEVCASELFTADELPTPTDAERQPPGAARQASLRL